MRFNFLKKHKGSATGLCVAFVILVSVCIPQTVHAGILLDLTGLTTLFVHLIFIPLTLSAWILTFAGKLLDVTINAGVIDIAKNISQFSGINITWAAIRDIANFGFIFVLLYAAIKMILGIGDMKKLLSSIVIAAVLINFSLFFTKVLIDASNVVALTFYNAASSCGKDGKQAPLSDCFVQPLGLSTIYQTPNDDFIKGLNTGSDFGKAAIVSIGGSIFLLITAFVMLAVALMFIIRLVTIIFLLIFSPLMVLGSTLPGLGAYSKKWWATLSDQALFAPAFMFMTWIVLKLISSNGFITANAITKEKFSDTFTGITGYSLILNFVIIITLIITTLTTAKGFSKHGGKLSTELAGKMMGGGAGYVGRRTIGSAGRALADSKRLKETASDPNAGWRGSMARLALRGGQSTAKASFDARGTSLGKKLDAGKASGKGGNDAYVKDQAKKHEDFAKSLGPSDVEIDEAKGAQKAADKVHKDALRGGDAATIRTAREKLDKATAHLHSLTGNKDEVAKEVKDLEDRRKKEVETAKNTSEEAEKLKKATVELEKARDDQKSSQDVYNRLQVEADATEGDAKAKKLRQALLAKEQFEHAKEGTDLARRNLDEADKAVKSKNNVIETEYKERYETLKETAKEREIKSAGDRRKEGYADVITNTSPYDLAVGNNRVGWIGMVKRQNKVAAAHLRGTGGKKKVEDMVKEAVKANEEGSEKAEGGEGETKPETGAGAGAGASAGPKT